MSRFSGFSVAELRMLQGVLSDSIENIRTSVVSDDGEDLASGLDAKQLTKVFGNAIFQELMLDEIHAEIDRKLTVMQ
jgi:hypothetical protein